MAENNNAHIFLRNLAVTFDYQPRQGFGNDNIPDRDRDQHSNKLLQEYQAAEASLIQIREERKNAHLPVKDGSYWEFSGMAGYSLVTKSLEDLHKDIRLLNIRTEGDEPQSLVTKAVVYVPKDQEQLFSKKISDYKYKTNKQGNPHNAPLVKSIEKIQLATVLSLWTDDPAVIPGNAARWCEVWLYLGKDLEALANDLQTACDMLDIQLSAQQLVFPERVVRLIRADQGQLAELTEQLDFIAELRLLRETARFWLSETNIVQTAWVTDLLNRSQFRFTDDIGVCILDTGVSNGHRLIAPILRDSDRHTVEPEWGVNDHQGHGTLMGGVAAYGDIMLLLQSQEKIEINHRLSAVKILPPEGANNKELYGAITSQAISRAELAAPGRRQVYCMAVTTVEPVERGRPTSYSAAIDQLAFGDFDDNKRLILISAGNVRDTGEHQNYPDSNISISVEDPAQAWNALTIGAITDKIIVTDPGYNEHAPIAGLGQLSPYSRTSATWERRKWPLKPDIVLEGGNILKAPNGTIIGTTDDLAILSTSHRPSNYQFDAFSGTSAATAYGGWMCAKIFSVYPAAWPETVRGLVIHSATLTSQLIQQFGIDITKKTQLAALMRICGYGVPDLSRAIQNTKNSFTLVAEEYIRPFTQNAKGRIIAKDMHYYKLPWPKEVLLGLGETRVKFKITLSYFIEPAPGSLEWKDRYRYQSFGLRFEVSNPTDTEGEFLKRINKALREEDEDVDTESGAERWSLGPNLRNLGSVHSDSWDATAAELSTCNYIAIYPVIGWWKERKHIQHWKEKTRYSLLISLETPEQNIDIYTPIYELVSTTIKVPVK